MITGEIKNKVDSLWEIFWTGGLTNPLSIIEQITYLMFIHDLDEIDNQQSKESAMLRKPYQSIFDGTCLVGGRDTNKKEFKWSIFRDLPPDEIYELVQFGIFPFIKDLHGDKNSTYSKYMKDAIFQIPNAEKLVQIVAAMDVLYETMEKTNNRDKDIKGDVYEYLLSKLSTAGTNGQFRTPRHIIRMIVDLLEPKVGDTICDPACGTSGFLVSAVEYLKENHEKDVFFNDKNREHFNNMMFSGYDMDRTMLRIGAMNMMTHGVENPFIEYRDSLSDQNGDENKFSIILANPPFKGSLDEKIVAPDLLKVCSTKKTELLFLALFLRMLKVGGRCASIVPDGVLFGSSRAHKSIREKIIEDNRLEAVISMPSGVFKPYAGVSTAILIFTKTNGGETDDVWFYDMRADGYSLDDKRSEIKDNDIPDIIERFHNRDNEKDRERTEQSFLVPKEEIVGNDYDLSINKYKKTEYVQVEYPPTKEIISDLHKLQQEITQGLKELEEMLHE